MKIALVGNQNSGKTTLFNCLTGMNAKIGNWPGVTIEKKIGRIQGTNHEIIDLPGIYSLSPYSVEEEISRKFIFDENPDMIINIVDSTSIERSLYLTTQLLELDCKVIIALNMTDLLEKKGLKIDEKKLSNELGITVCRISALKENGIDNLKREIDKIQNHKSIKIFDTQIEKTILKIEYELNKSVKNSRFVSIKILENDEGFNRFKNSEIKKYQNELEKEYDIDMEEVIATERYKFIEDVRKKCISKKYVKENKTEKLDKIFLNKWISLPIFIIIMFLVYYLSVGVVGKTTVNYIGKIMNSFEKMIGYNLNYFGTPEWLTSLIIDGLIAGVGTILGFEPQLIILFLCIVLLETTGYMSRISLILDKMFRKIGLSGKSLIPFIVGSGCSVPGIMTTKIIENEEERKMTAILTPFIPCSAKLPIITLFSGYFFPNNSGLLSASLYFLAIGIIIISSVVMNKFIFKKTSSTYISELPEYKIPDVKYIFKEVFDKIIEFIKRAGSVILLCSMIIWFLLSFSFKMEYGVNIEDSILATIGNKISWLFKPMIGQESWEAAISAIQGLVAKEQVVSSMAVINGITKDSEVGREIFNEKGSFGFFCKSSAYAFIVFNLFSAPCFGAIGAMKRELGKTTSLLKAITFQTVLAWILATIIYQVGSRIEFGVLHISNVMFLVVSLFIIIKILVLIVKKKNKCSNCPFSIGDGPLL